MIINNTYNHKALLKSQGALDSESCIIKGTPALKSITVAFYSVDLSSALCSRKVLVFQRKLFPLVGCCEAGRLATACLHYHSLLCL